VSEADGATISSPDPKSVLLASVAAGPVMANANGACLWADPYKWVPEAAQLLRPAGRLHFLIHAFLLTVCVSAEDASAAGDRLLRPAFGTHRIEWPTDNSVEFHLSHGGWIRLLGQSGFEIEDLVELRPKPDATTTYQFVTLEWARQGPAKKYGKPARC
jgi:hypothetical protein